MSLIASIIESAFSDKAPVAGTMIRMNGAVSMFCGQHKGRWILASENTSILDARKWDVSVARAGAYVAEAEGADPEAARRLFEVALSNPIAGSRVELHGESAYYLSPEGRIGMYHRLAVPITPSNVDRVKRFDLSKLVRVEGVSFGIITLMSESFSLRSFPEPGEVALAQRIIFATEV